MQYAHHITRPRLARYATIAILMGLMLALPIIANPATAQTSDPAPPTNLTATLTDTEGEVQLTWDAADGATQYRACQRVQTPAGKWTCTTRNTTNALFTGLTVDTAYDFAVASYNGSAYSAWAWAELTVEAVAPHFCPITGLAIPEGYLSVNESTTGSAGTTFKLTGITRKSTITLEGTEYLPPTGRQFLKVCGTVNAPSDSPTIFYPGTHNNLSTDLGIGFNYYDESVTNWFDVDDIPAGQTRRACDIWDVPADAVTVIYAVNNFRADAGVFRVDLP